MQNVFGLRKKAFTSFKSFKIMFYRLLQSYAWDSSTTRGRCNNGKL